MKKVLSLCIVLIFAFSVFSVSNAGEITPTWVMIMRVSNNLTINASGQASMSASITAYEGVQSVTMSTYLQRYENNTWVTIKNWVQEYPGASGYWSMNWFVAKGYNYRIRTYFYAYDGFETENTSLTSNSVYY